MIFVDISQYSRGEERADDRAFKNLNNLIATDQAIQQADEYFLGAPGREQAISLESQRQLGVANAIGPNLNAIVAADANAILGQAATRSVAGLTQQAVAGFTLPEIPTLASSQVATRVANAQNQQFRAQVTTPQSLAITSNQQQHDLTQQPTLFAQDSRANQFAAQTQPLQQNIELNKLRLASDLQAGEREYAIAYQQYQQQTLDGKIADQPTVQRLQRAQRNVDLLRTQYNSAQLQQRIARQPLQGEVDNAKLKLQQAITQVSAGNVLPDDAYNDAVRALNLLKTQTQTSQQPLSAEVNEAKLNLQKALTAASAGNVLPDDEYADAVRALNVLKTQTATEQQPAQASLSKTQTEVKQGQAEQALTNLTDDATIAELTRKLKIGELEFSKLNQPQQQRILDNELKVKAANVQLAVTNLPTETKIRTLQLGQALNEAEALKRNQGYANEVTDIKAQSGPAAATAAVAAQRFSAQMRTGLNIIQRLNLKKPYAVSTEELATVARQLQDNQLLSKTQTLSADSNGIYIQTPGQAPTPLNSLHQGILATMAKPSAPSTSKPTQYKSTVYIQDGVPYPVNTVTTSGAPPTAADIAFAGGSVEGQATAPVPSASAIIGTPASVAKQQLDAAAAAARGF